MEKRILKLKSVGDFSEDLYTLFETLNGDVHFIIPLHLYHLCIFKVQSFRLATKIYLSSLIMSG